jgi:predicted transcriptional regulator
VTDLLNEIQRDIDSRLTELRPLVREAEQLERAVAALNATDGSRTASSAGTSAKPAAARPRAARRATRRGDTVARVVEYLRAHPRSTARDIAEALNINTRSTSTRLTQLAKAGTIKKETRGYSA